MVNIFNTAVKKRAIALALQSEVCEGAKSLFSPSAHPAFEVVQVTSVMKDLFAKVNLTIPITPWDGRVAQLLVRAPLLFSKLIQCFR